MKYLKYLNLIYEKYIFYQHIIISYYKFNF